MTYYPMIKTDETVCAPHGRRIVWYCRELDTTFIHHDGMFIQYDCSRDWEREIKTRYLVAKVPHGYEILRVTN